MGVEIERKFLVRSEAWRQEVSDWADFRQGYLHSDPSLAVRVRLGVGEAFLTIKGSSREISRLEFEYAIPISDAEVMLERLCRAPLIEKRRHLLRRGPHLWEIDVFFGDNAGLVLAEIELSGEDEDFERPDWLGEEVSRDPRYYNARLAIHPYSRWGDR